MSTRARNTLQPYVDEIQRLTGLPLRLDSHDGGYKLETADQHKGFGNRYIAVRDMVIYLAGTVNGCRMLMDGLRDYANKEGVSKAEIAGLHADMLTSLIDGCENDELGQALVPIRDYLLRVRYDPALQPDEDIHKAAVPATK